MGAFKIIYGVCLFLLIAMHVMNALLGLTGMTFLLPDGKTEGDGSTNYEKFISLLIFTIYGGAITPVIVSLFQPLKIVKQYALVMACFYNTANLLILPFWQKNNKIFLGDAMYDGFIYFNGAVFFHLLLTVVCWTLFFGAKDNMILPSDHVVLPTDIKVEK